MRGDRVELLGVRATGFHGVFADEKRDGQEFIVDVSYALDTSRAAATDDVSETLSYAEVAAQVVQRITGPSVDLIETLASLIADDVLAHPQVEAVEVAVHKPQAPVGVPFADVVVRMQRRARREVTIAVGANLGDREATLSFAVNQLARWVRIEALGQLYETDPVGGPEQPEFLNTVLVGVTRLAPATLLARLHEIEAQAGRVREEHWGPRTLDLDLISMRAHHEGRGLANAADGAGASAADGAGAAAARGVAITSDLERLMLPHPRAHERAFVLAPWLDADPDAHLLINGRELPVRELVQAMRGTDGQIPGIRVSDAQLELHTRGGRRG